MKYFAEENKNIVVIGILWSLHDIAYEISLVLPARICWCERTFKSLAAFCKNYIPKIKGDSRRIGTQLMSVLK